MNGIMAVLSLTLAALGLLLPGYLAARVLGVPRGWLLAFPLSALLLVELVIMMSLLGIPLSFASMAAGLSGFVVLCLVLMKGRRPGPVLSEQEEEVVQVPRWIGWSCLGVVSGIVLLVTLRATLFPLSGFDTYFRWEGLSRAMLQLRSLDFYPPVSARDFTIYVFPDGIPPLVATVYWWLYAAIGRPLPEVTAFPVALQVTSILALIYVGALSAFGRPAAWFALLTASTSVLFIRGVAIGQETGFTALSVAGQLCFAWLAVSKPQRRLVVVAALFAALGALSREYGPALTLAGFSVLVWYPQTRRYLLLFVVVAAAFSAPWYLRCWFLTGNPFFPHAIPGGFPHNGVYAAIMEFYRQFRSVASFDRSQWLNLLGLVAGGAPFAVLVGLPFGIRRWRETGPLLITTTLITFLWLYSIGETAGGVVYSLRVLTPAVVALSICAGAGLATVVESDCWRRRSWRLFVFSVLGCGVVYAMISAASHPFPAQSIGSAFLSRGGDPPEFCIVQPELANNLQASSVPATGVLTDDMYLATILQRTTRFRPVMIWSPEVSFIFEGRLEVEEVRRRLLAQGVRVVAIENESPNTVFMMRYPFFQDYRRWNLLFAVSDRGAMFLLPEVQ